MEETIKIYPSNWLYNAGVIGFLNSVKKIEQKDVEKYFVDNIISLPRNIFENLEIEKRYFSDSKKNNISSIVGKSLLYRNYINPSRPQDKSGFADFVKKLSKIKEQGQNYCGICSRNFSFLPEDVKELNKKWAEYGKSKAKRSQRSKPETNGFEVFFSNLQKYNVAHNNLIATSKGKFPNAFWNFNDSLSICPLCVFLIIHHHIPFENANTQNGQIFINAPSFKIMWHLNEYASEILSKRKSYQLREILGISFMELAQKVSVTLGAWSIMNIEMVIKSYNRDRLLFTAI